MQPLDINFAPFDHAKALRLKPGDVLVFSCAQTLSNEQSRLAKIQLEATFPDHEILILDGGQSVEIVRPTPWWKFWR